MAISPCPGLCMPVHGQLPRGVRSRAPGRRSGRPVGIQQGHAHPNAQRFAHLPPTLYLSKSNYWLVVQEHGFPGALARGLPLWETPPLAELPRAALQPPCQPPYTARAKQCPSHVSMLIRLRNGELTRTARPRRISIAPGAFGCSYTYSSLASVVGALRSSLELWRNPRMPLHGFSLPRSASFRPWGHLATQLAGVCQHRFPQRQSPNGWATR